VGQFWQSSRVHGDLRKIWEYIAKDSIIQADRLLARFYDVFQLLSNEPGMGIHTEYLGPGTRRFPVGNYIIYYRKYRLGIQVLRVMHGMRDQRKALYEKK